MRNFLWLLGVLGCIGVAARFHPNPAQPTRADVAVSWHEWDEKGLSFSFAADPSGIQFTPRQPEELGSRTLSMVKETPAGATAVALHARLRKEVDIAMEEPCRGRKTKELTLREGSRSWTIEIGTYAGPSQARIIDTMNRSLSDLRKL